MTKLYVGNLPFKMTQRDLEQMFADFGPVVSATIIMDRATGRSKGFGFVELDSDDKAQQAISSLNGAAVEGRNLVVSVARPMEPRESMGGDRRDSRRDNRR
jgi:RNA recognition motif-containing protein